MTDAEREAKVRKAKEISDRIALASGPDGNVPQNKLWEIAQTLEPFSEERQLVEKVLIDSVRKTDPKAADDLEEQHKKFAALQVIQERAKEMAFLDNKIKGNAPGPDRRDSFMRRFQIMVHDLGMKAEAIEWAEEYGRYLPEKYAREAAQFVVQELRDDPHYGQVLEKHERAQASARTTRSRRLWGVLIVGGVFCLGLVYEDDPNWPLILSVTAGVLWGGWKTVLFAIESVTRAVKKGLSDD